LIGTAVGTAYALRMDGSKAIVVCCIGDAGTEQGVFWESINFAVLHSLPIAFICENNGMSVDAKIEERQAEPITPRVEAFGLLLCTSVEDALYSARNVGPSFHESKATLQCDHLNMSTLLPSLGLS
jgi:transketolase N-terminal domain/subunit